jgi:hypothetical protein
MQNGLYIKEIKGKGRGVFCNKDIAAGAIIEVCPIIVVQAEDVPAIQNTRLVDYSFYFNRDENLFSLAMGFGSMYNYARYPNASHELNHELKIMLYTASTYIPAHTEICINYSGEYGNDFSRWFADRGIDVI